MVSLLILQMTPLTHSASAAGVCLDFILAALCYLVSLAGFAGARHTDVVTVALRTAIVRLCCIASLRTVCFATSSYAAFAVTRFALARLGLSPAIVMLRLSPLAQQASITCAARLKIQCHAEPPAVSPKAFRATQAQVGLLKRRPQNARCDASGIWCSGNGNL